MSSPKKPILNRVINLFVVEYFLFTTSFDFNIIQKKDFLLMSTWEDESTDSAYVLQLLKECDVIKENS